jgi:hypothetical protein
MADYYPLISRAVAGLERNTGENRRSLYERARNALLDQLRSITPALSETEITRERLGLEEAIRKVEADVARRMREEIPRPSDRPPASQRLREALRPEPGAPPRPVLGPSAPPPGQVDTHQPPPPTPESRPPFGRVMGRPDVTAADLRRAPPRSPFGPTPPERKPPEPPPPAFTPPPEPELPEAEHDFTPQQPEAPISELPHPEPPPLAPSPVTPPPELDEPPPRRFGGMPGFLGRKRAEAPAPTAPPKPSPVDMDLDREFEPSDDDTPYRDLAGARSFEPPPMEGVRAAPAPARPMAEDEAEAEAEDKVYDKGRIGRLLNSSIGTIAIAGLLIALVGGALFWQRDAIKSGLVGIFTLARGPSAQAPRDTGATAPSRSKIPDRIGQAGQAQPDQSKAQEAAAPGHVVLYEEDPNDPNGKRYTGTVVWSLENVPAGPGQPMDKAIRGDISIPERNMTVTFTIRRNTDKDLPASHTVSINFTLPADFSHGGIQEIRGLLMKQSESTRGVALAGLSVKVTTGFFLIGLSATEGDVQRNVQMLKERGWFDIAVVYNDNRRAILAVEKGPQGERVFNDAFAAWGQ